MDSSGAGGNSEQPLDDMTLQLSGFTKGAFFADRYRLEALLGVGAMGKVFRATDTAKDQAVALKVLHLDTARKPQVLERFRREAEILRELGHPGIVQVYEAGQSAEGIDYLSMELLQGETLRSRIKGRGPFTPEELLPILVALCDAIGAAHQQEVLHRDLKPDNIFLMEEGTPPMRVLDFGLGRIASNERITRTGVMIGTPRYMAPEQIRSAKHTDARTDIYACGVIVHEALTGSSPFAAEDQGQLLGCVMEGRVLRLEDQRPGVPAALGDVVRKAMAKDAKDRFATIGAFAEAFAKAIGQTTGRSALLEEGLEALFEDAEETEGRLEPIDMPLPQSTPAFEIPRFTRPPTMPEEPPQALVEALEPEERPPPEVAPTPGSAKRIGWPLFVLAFIVVTCTSAGIALGVRGCLRATSDSATSAAP